MSDTRGPIGRTPDRRVQGGQQRGGYAAPATPFSLPEMPSGPAQGASSSDESSTDTSSASENDDRD